MSVFEMETRTCATCGQRWEALTFWRTDMPCSDCGLAAYRARLAEVSATRPYTIDSLGGACPTQAEGRTDDDRPFYFRARHGEWTLSVGDVGAPIDSVYDFDGNRAEGDDPSGGFMEWDDVLPILDAHLGAAL